MGQRFKNAKECEIVESIKRVTFLSEENFRSGFLDKMNDLNPFYDFYYTDSYLVVKCTKCSNF